MKLVSCIVPRGSGDKVAEAARVAGSEGGTIIMGRGTASRTWLEMLGLGDTQRDIAFFLVPDAIAGDVAKAASESCEGPGITFSIDVARFFRGGVGETPEIQGGQTMGDEGHKVICAVLNKGLAGDAMAAARKAGAKGGTVVNARGTASEDDARFFGVTLTPEKEMLVIVALADVADDVFGALSSLPCLTGKGGGIVFALPAAIPHQ